MSKRLRRYEILLPLQFNDGTPVPAEINMRTLDELRNQFGALTIETLKIEGQWTHEGRVYRDELFRVVIDAPGNTSTAKFFHRFKQTLKSRYQQIDIWITTHPIHSL